MKFNSTVVMKLVFSPYNHSYSPFKTTDEGSFHTHALPSQRILKTVTLKISDQEIVEELKFNVFEPTFIREFYKMVIGFLFTL